MKRWIILLFTVFLILFMFPLAVHAQAIMPGFDANTLARNDDQSTGLVDIGFTVNFFGLDFTQLYVNNNGNVTFDATLSSYTPFDLTSTGRQIIAPFFADVDTRVAGDPVTYGPGTYEGRPAFGVNYVNVDYYSSSLSHTNRNSFQVILVDRSDNGSGNFDIVFNYDQIQWEAGTASGGNSDGLGGNSARVGYSNGTGAPGTFYELPGSAINGAFLDGGPYALISNRLNSNVNGRYIFQSRGGTIGPITETGDPIYHYLTINQNGEGTTMPYPGDTLFLDGAIVILEAFPAEGWQFARWVVGGQTFNTSMVQITINSYRSATVYFERIGEAPLPAPVEPEPQPETKDPVEEPEPEPAEPEPVEPEAPVCDTNIIILTIDSTIALVDGVEVIMDVAPFLIPEVNRTMIPYRFISEKLCAEVYWLAETRQVRIVSGDTEILLTIDSTTALINGQAVMMDWPAEIRDSRTFVPLRFVSESLGARVYWDGETNTITIIR